MDQQKLDYFRNLLLEQRRQATEDLSAERSAALEDDGAVKDEGDVSQMDENRDRSFEVASKDSELIGEIDEALRRIDDGTYGQCERCGKPIDEERLKAIPTARYDAQCQAKIEAAQGTETPSL
jgi:DnaK suppressor protein